jgi:hypothetical protein
MTATKEKPTSEKVSKPTDEQVLNLLYTQVVKPENVIREYRINIWTSVEHAFIPRAGKITQSYFCIVDKDGLSIKS